LTPGKVLDPIFQTFSRCFREFVNLENKKKSNVVLVLFGRFCVPERFRTTNDKVSQSDEDIGLPRRRRKVVDPIVQTFFRRFREFVNLLENKKKKQRRFGVKPEGWTTVPAEILDNRLST